MTPSSPTGTQQALASMHRVLELICTCSASPNLFKPAEVLANLSGSARASVSLAAAFKHPVWLHGTELALETPRAPTAPGPTSSKNQLKSNDTNGSSLKPATMYRARICKCPRTDAREPEVQHNRRMQEVRLHQTGNAINSAERSKSKHNLASGQVELIARSTTCCRMYYK